LLQVVVVVLSHLLERVPKKIKTMRIMTITITMIKEIDGDGDEVEIKELVEKIELSVQKPKQCT